MGTLIFLALLGAIAYIVYLKFATRRNEVIIHVETTQELGANEERTSPIDEDKDNWERFDFYLARMLPACGKYRIKYEDQRGLKTEREIEVKRVYEIGGKYAFDAHCLLRGAHRSFIDDRISDAINVETGELVSSVARNALDQYISSDEGRVLAAIDREWVGVALLLYVCRADGQMRKPERAVVAEYLKQRCSDLNLSDLELDAAIKNAGEPDNREFKRFIRELVNAGKNDQLKDIRDCAIRIVSTQKTVSPLEKAALEMLTEAVNKAAV